MHKSVMEWMEWKVQEYKLTGKKVLELGSLDVNGSVRELFATEQYIGVDLQNGVGVDMVMDANKLHFEDKSFDIVLSTEMLEHDLYFWETIREAYRVLRRNGHFLLTTRGIGFPEHNFPADYYRFTVSSISALLVGSDFVTIMVEDDPEYSGVFAHAKRS